jgi:class 3 adenylate cyclase/tetratricopeptide (TPR) repeat protein
MAKSLKERIATLREAIAAQEGARAMLGDAVADATIAALKEHLADLEAQGAPSDRQRKQATVLFADVSGFTAMSERMDAEAVSDRMNALWQRVDAAIVAHGGTIDKHMGDAVMALWGVGEAREDDPERAVRAALAMQAEAAEFRDEHDVRLAMRIGINTGPVLLGGVGTTDEFSAIGDTVNVASRLEGTAPVGGVLISHDTYRQVRGIFDVRKQELITVRGRSEPVQTYVVERARPRAFRRGTRGVEGIETCMVGRDTELLVLQCAFRDAAAPPAASLAEGAATRVVTIVGEAGVGKSRLLYEFERWIASLPHPVACLKGRAAPAMADTPYSLIRDVLADRFNICESDPAPTVLAKFRAGMGGVLTADRADLVGHFFGFDLSASQAVQNLLGSSSFGRLATAYLTDFLRAVAGEPTVIFLEDIHWADEGSLDLVSHLVAEIPAGSAHPPRLLVICLARPSLFERRPGWGQGKGAYIRLDVEPLSRDDARALVGQILHKVDALPDDLRDLIVDRAGGNPFYVEEFIKMLIEDGVIVRREDGQRPWHAAPDRLAGIPVPPTLTGVLQARLDGLPREERRVLQRASVIGRLFWDAAVARLASGEGDSADVTPLLGALQSRELIFRRERSAFEGTDEFIFKHALLRDVTYETVLLELRRVYHARAARWLEANTGERASEYLGLIAGHYELAGDTTRAADYLRRLGEELHKVSAFRDAMGAFERALALLPAGDAARRAVLLADLGDAYNAVGDGPAARKHLEEGLALAHQAGDWRTQVAALNWLGEVARGQGAYEEARTLFEKALALAHEGENEIDDRAGMADLLRNLAYSALQRGESEEAGRYGHESLAVAREIDDRRGIAHAFLVLGMVAQRQGEPEQAAHYCEKSLAIRREIGHRRGISNCLLVLGEFARQEGRHAEAARRYEEALAIHRETGDRPGIAICLNNLGHAHAGMDEDDVAWGYLRGALREIAAIGASHLALEPLVGVAVLQAKAGRHARAAELLGLVQGHPAFDAEVGQYADPVLATLRETLPANQLEAALARGAALELEAVIAEVLAGSGASERP